MEVASLARASNDVQIFRRVNGMKLAKAMALHEVTQAKLVEQTLKIAVRAEGFLNAGSHERTGASQITVSDGKVDMFVNLTDAPPAGKGRALSMVDIERGTVRSRGIHALARSIGRVK